LGTAHVHASVLGEARMSLLGWIKSLFTANSEGVVSEDHNEDGLKRFGPKVPKGSYCRLHQFEGLEAERDFSTHLIIELSRGRRTALVFETRNGVYLHTNRYWEAGDPAPLKAHGNWEWYLAEDVLGTISRLGVDVILFLDEKLMNKVASLPEMLNIASLFRVAKVSKRVLRYYFRNNNTPIVTYTIDTNRENLLEELEHRLSLFIPDASARKRLYESALKKTGGDKLKAVALVISDWNKDRGLSE
jgi:hypothetical protein